MIRRRRGHLDDPPSSAAPEPPRDPVAERDERRAERLVLACFAVSTLAGVGLLAVYIAGGQTQIEGILLTLCLGGLGIGIVTWGQRLMPARIHIEPRHPVASDPEDIEELGRSLTEEGGFGRRRLLIGGLGAAMSGLAAALAIPTFSLGPAPDRSLRMTSWRGGALLATEDGEIRADDVPVGSVTTVFPDGDASDPNAATLLIRVEPGALPPGPDAAMGAPADFVAYSKVCTHAGCPVGLYRSAQHVLICPCHQSEFDVLDGARPISGPAARALPRLPIRQEADGTFVALDDYPEPVGPSFWDMRR